MKLLLIFGLNFISLTASEIIDFKKLKVIQNSVKGIDAREFDASFSMFIEAAGFDDLIEKYSEKVKETVERKIQDSLINFA